MRVVFQIHQAAAAASACVYAFGIPGRTTCPQCTCARHPRIKTSKNPWSSTGAASDPHLQSSFGGVRCLRTMLGDWVLTTVCILPASISRQWLSMSHDRWKEASQVFSFPFPHLGRLGFCNAASRATDFLGIFADGPDCEKCALRFGAPTRSPKAAFARVFTIESLSLLQYEEDPHSCMAWRFGCF